MLNVSSPGFDPPITQNHHRSNIKHEMDNLGICRVMWGVKPGVGGGDQELCRVDAVPEVCRMQAPQGAYIPYNPYIHPIIM